MFCERVVSTFEGNSRSDTWAGSQVEGGGCIGESFSLFAFMKQAPMHVVSELCPDAERNMSSDAISIYAKASTLHLPHPWLSFCGSLLCFGMM